MHHRRLIVTLRTLALIGVAAAVWSHVSTLAAQRSQMSSDEAAIRDAIGRINKGEPPTMTGDAILYSSAYKKPSVRGGPPPEEVPSNRRPSDRKPDANRTNITPIRIEVAKSGDLAYEYSDARLGFEMKDGRKIEIPTSILRVWRKEGGQWKVAAQFSVRHYDASIDRQ